MKAVEATVGRRSIHQILPSARLGGGELVALGLAKHVSSRGARSVVWAPKSGPIAAVLADAALAWRPLPIERMHCRPAVRALSCIRAAIGFSVERAAIVHFHNPLVFGLLRRSLWRSNVSSIVHVHLEPTVDEIQWAFAKPPKRIVTCAGYLRGIVCDALGERGRDTKIVALRNAVDTNRFSPGDRAQAKARLGAPGDRPLLLMMANLSPHKGQETALRAVAQLKARGVDAACWLAGEERDDSGQFTRRLQALCTDLQIGDRVRFLGFRDDAPDLLRAADLLLLPSRHEGLPLVIVEAQASKTPVLAAPTAGVPEVVIDGQTGFLVAADAPELYARRIEELLADRGLYERIADAAYARVLQEHRWETFCQRTWDLYQEVEQEAACHA